MYGQHVLYQGAVPRATESIIVMCTQAVLMGDLKRPAANVIRGQLHLSTTVFFFLQSLAKKLLHR